MFRNIFLRFLFLLLQFISAPVLFGQAPIEIISPEVLSGPIDFNNSIDTAYVLCENDTVALRVTQPLSGHEWLNFNSNSTDYEVLVGSKTSSNLKIRLKIGEAVVLFWGKGFNRIGVNIQYQKPTTPDAGENITICQDSLQLSAKNPAIGKGRWIRPSKDITFSDSTSNTAIVRGLPYGVTKLIWQVSSVCDTLQDEIEINNQSILPSDVQAGSPDTSCTDTASLFAKQLPIGYTGKWYNESNTEVGTTEIVHGVNLPKSANNTFKWEVTNAANCKAIANVTITHTILTQANIVLPTNDTTVCSNQIELRGENKGGTWSENGNIIDTGKTTVKPLLLGNNVFYRIFTDPICGESKDSVLVVNKTVDKPFVGLDATVCNDSVMLTTNSQLSGYWTNIKNKQQIGTDKTVKVGSSRADTISYSWTTAEQGSVCTASDTIQITYRKIQSAVITLPKNDTTVCAQTITLKALGGGTWSKLDSPFTSTQNNLINQQISPDNNTFYWTVVDPVCGTFKDTVTIINKSVIQPILVKDSCFVEPFVSSIGLKTKNNVAGLWSSSSVNVLNTGNNGTASFAPNGTGLYKFLFTASNTSGCSSKDSTSYYLITKADLPNDTCLAASVPNQKITIRAKNKLQTGERGYWSVSPGIANIDLAKVDSISFAVQSGTYKFKYNITNEAICTSCGKCNAVNVDSMVVTIVNKASIVPVLTSCITDSVISIKGNTLAIGETGVWTVDNGATTSFLNQSDLVINRLNIGKTKMNWTVSRGTCPSVASDSITRITKPYAGADKCYRTGVVLTDTLRGSKLAQNETGSWEIILAAGINVFPMNSLLLVKPGDANRGAYYMRWKVFSKDCPNGFADTVRMTVVTNPIKLKDTSFVLPISLGASIKSPSIISKPREMEQWSYLNTVLVGQSELTLPINLPAGTYPFVYTISSDSLKTCPFSTTTNVTYLSKPTILGGNCLKSVFNTTIRARAAKLGEKGTWKVDTTGGLAYTIEKDSAITLYGLQSKKYKLYWTIGSLTSSFSVTDSIVITKLSVPQPLNLFCSKDTFVTLKPAMPILLQSYETANWIKRGGNGASVFKNQKYQNDTLYNLPPGRRELAMVIKDDKGCADTSVYKILTTVSKANAKAASEFNICSLQNSARLNAKPPVVGVEIGRWTVLRQQQGADAKFTDYTSPTTSVNNLALRNTRLGWKVMNIQDTTCSTSDSMRVVVGSRAIPKFTDTCLVGKTSITLLGNNNKQAYEHYAWFKKGETKVRDTTTAFQFDSLLLGVNQFVLRVYDTNNGVTPNYTCPHDTTITVNVVSKASILKTSTCLVLPSGGVITDTLIANKPNAKFGYNWTAAVPLIPSRGISDTTLFVNYNKPGVYTNKWQVLLSKKCFSRDSLVTTVISEAKAGRDSCLIGADVLSLSASAPSKGEKGKWSTNDVSKASFVNDTLYTSNVNFNTKGFVTLQWKIRNGTCADSSLMRVSTISKATSLPIIPNCLKDIDSVQLQGNAISLSEKSIWQTLPLTKDTLFKASSGKVKVVFGVNRFRYTVFDPQYPTCLSPVDISVSVLQKPVINAISACNSYHPTINNVSVPLEVKPTTIGLTYQWKKALTLKGDTIIDENNSPKLQYDTIGKRTLWFKSFVTQDPTCSDSVLKTIQVITKVVFKLDTCVTDSVFRFIPAMYPDFNSGEYILAIINGKQFRIKEASDFITYPKGRNEVNWTVKSADSLCTVNLDDSPFFVNYISKSSPSEATVCKYFKEGLEVPLSLPQKVVTTTENGAWLSGDGLVQVVNNIATKIQYGKNLLKWRITSNSSDKCYSDSTVNYYTLTPSGFSPDTTFICSKETSINANPPRDNEKVDWQFKPEPTIVNSTDSSVSIKDLSNDITYTLFRTIRPDSVSCNNLKDSIKVRNKQVDDVKINTNGLGNDGSNFTCNSSTRLTVNNPKNDIRTAKGKWEILKTATQNFRLDSNNANIDFIARNILNQGEYKMVWSVSNYTCKPKTDTILIIRKIGLAGLEPFNVSICDSSSYDLGTSNIKLFEGADTAIWLKQEEGTTVVIKDNKVSSNNKNNIYFKDLANRSENHFTYTAIKDGCKGEIPIIITVNTAKYNVLADDSIVNQCDKDTDTLIARHNLLEPKSIYFKMYWSNDKFKIDNLNLTPINHNDIDSIHSVIVQNIPVQISRKVYVISKNGICPAKIDSVTIFNYQKIDSISAGLDDTLCLTKLNLKGYKSQSFANGSWYNISGDRKDSLGTSNLTAILKPNTLNAFLWKVTNGICQKTDTLKILVGDSISTAKVDKDEIIDCGKDEIQLKADTALHGGIGFWWTNPNDTLSKINEFEYSFKPKSSKDILQFYYTIKNNYCRSTDTTTVYYFQTPSIANAGQDQTLVKKQTVMNANQPTVGIGTWILKNGTGTIENVNNPTANISDLVFGKNVFIWRISNGATCPVSEDEVILGFSDFDIPQAFSPNGDGKNDRFEIVGLENYSGSKLKVLNRWGREVFTSDDYKNNWEGAGLEEDTYFFILEIPGIEIKKGYVVIKRK